MPTPTPEIDRQRYFTRHYLYLLVGLVLFAALITIAFLRWQTLLFTSLETETYEYHLATMLNCARISDELRHLEYEHLGGRRADAVANFRTSPAISLNLIRDALATINQQQRRYNAPEFAGILAKADRLLAGLLATPKGLAGLGTSEQQAVKARLRQLLICMEQLQRLHAIAYDEHRMALPIEQRHAVKKIIFFFLGTGTICGWLTSKLLKRIKRAEERLRHFHVDLRNMVDVRTSELMAANTSLQEEIAVRAKIEKQLEQARDEAETANRAKSDFLATMSHEIRTPMNAIIGMNRLALAGDPPVEIKGFLEVVGQSADSLLVLINDILDFSKIEAGQLELAEYPFRLDGFMAALPANFMAAALERGNTISVELADGIYPSLIGDEQRLRQILVNLIGNAVKFTERGRITVAVKVEEEGEHDLLLRFAVTDTGIGVPEELHARIFESFSQADSGINRRYGGTGLGLAICRRLAGLLGGEIWLRSKAGEGSTFYFTARFKKGDPQLAAEPVVAGDEDYVATRQLAILLVEDNKFNRELAAVVLEQAGHRVQATASGLEALTALSRERFDLILMDVQMPEMDGLGATALIRRCEAGRAGEAEAHRELLLRVQERLGGRHIPIVAMTAHALVGDRERFLAAGMDDYIAKPFRPEELFAALGRLVGPATEG